MLTSKSYLGLRGQSLSNAIGVAAGLCFFIYGYGQGVTGAYLTVESFYTQFPEIETQVDSGPAKSLRLGFTIAIWNLGCFCSAILTVFIGDRLGRRKMVFGGLILLIIGEIIQTTSFVWAQMLVGRFVSGFGLGFNCATIPAWQAECTKAYRRGTLLMISAGVMIAGGMAFAYWTTFGFRFLDSSSASWRFPIGLQVIWAIMALVVMISTPESPRWLILNGREGEALEVLSALNDLDIDDNQIHQEFLQIKDAVIEMSQGSFISVFKMGDYRDGHRVILAIVLQFCQQIGGINFMTQYFGTMFMNQYQWIPPYHSVWNATILAAGAGTCFFLASFIGVACIDRVTGRRGLMLFGTTGMLISMIVLTIMLWMNTRPALDAGTAFVFIFTSCYAIGWQGMSWIYQVEVVPLRVRGPANALSTASNWLGNFIVTFIAPIAFTALRWKSYLIFVCTNAVILPIVYFLYPETSLRCLEEMDYIFHTANSSPRPWLDVVEIAANEPLWYGRDSEDFYDYEASEWHQRHVRFSDEVKDESGESSTLRASDHGEVDKISSGGGLPGLVLPGGEDGLSSSPPLARMRFGSGSESDDTAVARSRSRGLSRKG